MRDPAQDRVDNVVLLHGQDQPMTPTPEPVNNLITVTVSFGPTTQEFQVMKGHTIAQVLADPYIKEIIGFGGRETVMLNGRQAAATVVLTGDEQIELIKEAGQKA